MKKFLKKLTKKTLEIFPRTTAIVLWGSTIKRGEILKYGDVDVLIVVKNGSLVRPPMVAALKKEFKNIDLDPCVITESNLHKNPIVSMGMHGDYEAHGLIHYQLKHESRVIYGKKNILRHISPITFREALLDIVLHEKNNFIPRLNSELESLTIAKFITSNLGYLMVLMRTIYSVQTGKITTKEKALAYVAKKYPNLKNLNIYLLSKYKKVRTKKSIDDSAIKNLLDVADKSFANLLRE